MSDAYHQESALFNTPCCRGVLSGQQQSNDGICTCANCVLQAIGQQETNLGRYIPALTLQLVATNDFCIAYWDRDGGHQQCYSQGPHTPAASRQLRLRGPSIRLSDHLLRTSHVLCKLRLLCQGSLHAPQLSPFALHPCTAVTQCNLHCPVLLPPGIIALPSPLLL